MSPAAQKPARKPSVEKEMSNLGAVQKVRFGLAPKFTIPVSIALSLVIVAMGFVVYGATAESLEKEINKNGIFAARLAASPEIDSWDEGYNTSQDLIRRLAAIEAALAEAGGRFGPDASAAATEDEKRVLKEIEKYDSSQKNANIKRLRGLLSQGALDLWIISGGQKLKASAAGRPSPQFREHRTIPFEDSPESRIVSGVYNVGKPDGEVWEPARFFTHPIKDRDGKSMGQATVVFSERGLRTDLDDLRSDIIMFCVIGVLVCGAVAFVSSKTITAPLGALLQDINAVAGGDLQHKTRMRSRDEIGVLAATFEQMTRNLASAEQMRVTLAEKEHQVLLAQEIQERLFPRKLPAVPGMALDAANRLAEDLSADLFDVIVRDDGRLGILVMTSSGRGFPAAIVLSMARALFRARGAAQPSAAETLRAINSLLSPDLRRGFYVSALYALIDPATGAGVLASAGHRVPALHYVAAGQGLRKLQTSGIAMGLDKGPVFDRSLAELAFTLAPGDRLIVATEGAFLLRDAQDQPLGEDAFLKLVLAAAKKGASAEALLSSLSTRLGAKPGEHDITLFSAARSGGEK